MGKGQRRRARQRGGNPSVLSEEEIAFQRQLAKAQADSLRDQDQEASLRAWTGKHLEEMLGFPDTQEIVKHMMTMKTPQVSLLVTDDLGLLAAPLLTLP